MRNRCGNPLALAALALACVEPPPEIPPEQLGDETCTVLPGAAPHALHVAQGERTSWATPTMEAVAAIASLGLPVVDFGAGTGYWAYLLDRAGVDVVAYDDWSGGHPARLWHPVETGGVEALAAHRNHALLLVWPPLGPMAARALDAWDGDTLVYVGHVRRINADPAFFDALRDGWRLERRVDLPNWAGNTDELFILRRDPAGDATWLVDELARCVGHETARALIEGTR